MDNCWRQVLIDLFTHSPYDSAVSSVDMNGAFRLLLEALALSEEAEADSTLFGQAGGGAILANPYAECARRLTKFGHHRLVQNWQTNNSSRIYPHI